MEQIIGTRTTIYQKRIDKPARLCYNPVMPDSNNSQVFQVGDLVEMFVTFMDDRRYIIADKGSLGIVIGIQAVGETSLSYLVHFPNGQQLTIASHLLKKVTNK